MYPAEIGPYRIEGCLAKGTWSCLYIARDVHHTLIVIKALSPRSQDYQEALKRFQKEAHILQKLSHPYIVKLLGSGVFEETPYIAMERLEGVSLREWILYRPFSLSQAVHLILDIAYAICHLHTHGVVHRDLKPENILLTPERSPRLLDFGIARLLADQEEDVHQEPTTFMGTPVYMSPEQRDHPQYVSYTSDLYSLGIIAYEIILGRLSQGHIHLALMPKGMQKILRRMLQPNVLDRYPDIVDFIVDLSSYLNSAQFLDETRAVQPLYPFWEQLQRTQQSLLPRELSPSQIFISAISYRDHTVTWGGYLDRLTFTSHDDMYEELVILAESCRLGAEGVSAVSSLRARLHSLLHTPKPLQEHLEALEKQMILEGNLEGMFFLHGLHFNQDKQRIRAFSYGTAGIWWIEGDQVHSIEESESLNALFGMSAPSSLKSIEKPYNPLRRWILHTHAVIVHDEQPAATSLYTPLAWKKRLLETASYSPQDQANALMKPALRQGFVDIHAPLQACLVLQEL